MSQQVVTERLYELMNLAFDHVCDPKNWKAPIDALVPAQYVKIYVDAVKHMTSTDCEVFHIQDEVPIFVSNVWGRSIQMYRIKSIGYQAGPAGDH